MHTLTFTLKQHTPIIYFQHEQDGATLRASELKPKLDKYLVENVLESKFDNCKRYLVGYTKDREDKWRERFAKEGFRALDYRVRSVRRGLG